MSECHPRSVNTKRIAAIEKTSYGRYTNLTLGKSQHAGLHFLDSLEAVNTVNHVSERWPLNYTAVCTVFLS